MTRGYLSDLPTGVNRQLPGRGPWRILPECPARLHCTLSAARGRRGRAGSQNMAKCVCPRALHLKDLDNQRNIARVQALRNAVVTETKKSGAGRPTGTTQVTPKYMANVKKVTIPDLSRGLCRTPLGMAIMDAASETGGNALHRKRAKAVEMCEGCPVKRECGDYVIAAEDPAGSWGHIYAGMTVTDRMKRRTQG